MQSHCSPSLKTIFGGVSYPFTVLLHIEIVPNYNWCVKWRVSTDLIILTFHFSYSQLCYNGKYYYSPTQIYVAICYTPLGTHLFVFLLLSAWFVLPLNAWRGSRFCQWRRYQSISFLTQTTANLLSSSNAKTPDDSPPLSAWRGSRFCQWRRFLSISFPTQTTANLLSSSNAKTPDDSPPLSAWRGSRFWQWRRFLSISFPTQTTANLLSSSNAKTPDDSPPLSA